MLLLVYMCFLLGYAVIIIFLILSLKFVSHIRGIAPWDNPNTLYIEREEFRGMNITCTYYTFIYYIKFSLCYSK